MLDIVVLSIVYLMLAAITKSVIVQTEVKIRHKKLLQTDHIVIFMLSIFWPISLLFGILILMIYTVFGIAALLYYLIENLIPETIKHTVVACEEEKR